MRLRNGKPRIFMILGADYGNIGDALIYRRAVGWFHDLGQIHANVGQAPPVWDRQIGIEDAVVYRSTGSVGRVLNLIRWAGALLMAPRRAKALVFDTGETPLTTQQLAKELLLLVVTALAKLTGATVIRPPHAIRKDPSALTVAVYRIACRMSDVVLFREPTSRDRVGSGELVPDLGFSEPGEAGMPRDKRRLLVVSMRGHTDIQDEEWIWGVRDFAKEAGLGIVVSAQVTHDIERARYLADRLGAIQTLGVNCREELALEGQLRDAYCQARLVISDRMHVAVYGAVCGATPTEVVAGPSGKIRDHFAVAGVRGVSLDSTGASAADITEFLRRVDSRHHEIAAAIVDARACLEVVRAQVRSTLNEKWKGA